MNYKFVLGLIVGLMVLVGGVFAFDIGYVVDGSGDSAIIDVIEDLGYTYEIINGDDVSGVDFDDYELIIVGDGRFLDYEDIPVGDVKSLVLNGKYTDEWGIAEYVSSSSSNSYEYGNIFSHDITAGLGGSVKLYNSKGARVYVLPSLSSKRAPDLKKVVTRTIGGYITLGVLEKGGRLYGGGFTDEKIVFFGITESDYWTSETKDMFENSIEWLVGAVVVVDNDEDGYNSIETGGNDCDDDDASVYPGAEDLSKNCVNDVPILTGTEIGEIIWEQGGSVVLDLDNYFTDPDGDDLTYFYTQPSNEEIDISIIGSIATFSSSAGWTGEDKINFRAEDDSGESILINNIDLKVLEEVIEELIISSYSPVADDIKILDGDSQEFSVVVLNEDVDVNWFIDNGFGYYSVGVSGLSYLFDEAVGDYTLKAVVSKTGFDDVEREWDVVVGDISDFTCSEVSGNVCTSEEICSEDFLGVSDSSLCCSVSCSEKPLEFNDINREEVTGDIGLEIRDPEENEEFVLGETISLRLYINNNVDEKLSMDVKVYLYDLTEDEVVEDYDYTTDVDKDSSKILNIDFKIPYDIVENNDYAIFVQINDEDEEYFNEDYVRVKLKRDDYKVIIDKISFVEKVSCGDYFNVEVKLKNIGSEDVKSYLEIENSVLKIKEKTEEFELEAYDGKDSFTRIFNFKIPNDAEKEIYGIKVSAYFGGKKIIETKNIVIDCKESEVSVDSIDVVKLGGESSNSEVSKGVNGFLIFGFVLMFVLGLSFIGGLVYVRFGV